MLENQLTIPLAPKLYSRITARLFSPNWLYIRLFRAPWGYAPIAQGIQDKEVLRC